MSATSRQIAKPARLLSLGVAVILVAAPFHAFLTVWASSRVGHYTLLRLWEEFLLVPLLLGAGCLLFRQPLLMRRVRRLRLAWLVALYLLVLFVAGFVALATASVSAKAMWYGLLVDSRFLIFFFAVLIISSSSGWLRAVWPKLLFIPAGIVSFFAILQYRVLPYDFLKHFGYGPNTIAPYETINHNLSRLRVASFLRGANPLGAYVVTPLTALAATIFKSNKSKLWLHTALGLALTLALIFSFSRGAWMGAALGGVVVAWFSLKSQPARRLVIWVSATAILTALIAGILLRNNLSFQDFIFHTDSASTISASSNGGHSAAFKSAGRDIIHQPLGGGVGTAGPQSVYNRKPPRIAENYFLQIGQEAGIAGMVLFIAICLELGHLLYQRRGNLLCLVLLGSLVGLSLVNLLSHAWEDDTLAYIFWGLAGVALSTDILKPNHEAAD